MRSRIAPSRLKRQHQSGCNDNIGLHTCSDSVQGKSDWLEKACAPCRKHALTCHLIPFVHSHLQLRSVMEFHERLREDLFK